MKTVLLICDGMPDTPSERLEGRTSLEVAKTPALDALAQSGRVGLLQTIPNKMDPGSDVGLLSLLGFDPQQVHPGRGPLEALHLGVPLQEHEVAFRCNLITLNGDQLSDHSAGRITTEEASKLLDALNAQVGSAQVEFHLGHSYRHLAVFKDPSLTDALLKTRCTSPHDMLGQSIEKFWPQGAAAEALKNVLTAAHDILVEHEINQVRVDLGENPASGIWLWGQGKQTALPTLQERWQARGAVVSAVDLVRGAGQLMGFDVLDVPDINGYYDTNFEGKAQAAINALEDHDVVVVHVEAAEAASHNGDLRQKITAIENFDKLVVGPIAQAIKGQDVRLLVTASHATSVEQRTHTAAPVPFVVAGAGIEAGSVAAFYEATAEASDWKPSVAHELLPLLVQEPQIAG